MVLASGRGCRILVVTPSSEPFLDGDSFLQEVIVGELREHSVSGSCNKCREGERRREREGAKGIVTRVSTAGVVAGVVAARQEVQVEVADGATVRRDPHSSFGLPSIEARNVHSFGFTQVAAAADVVVAAAVCQRRPSTSGDGFFHS